MKTQISQVFRGDSNIQIGTVSIVDPNEFPIKLYFSEERSRSLWVLDYKGDNDLQGTWKSNDGSNLVIHVKKNFYVLVFSSCSPRGSRSSVNLVMLRGRFHFLCRTISLRFAKF